MQLEIDRRANAAYVTISDADVAETRELDPYRRLDVDGLGKVIGIEFLSISRGVDLSELPHRPHLERLFNEHHIPIFA